MEGFGLRLGTFIIVTIITVIIRILLSRDLRRVPSLLRLPCTGQQFTVGLDKKTDGLDLGFRPLGQCMAKLSSIDLALGLFANLPYTLIFSKPLNTIFPKPQTHLPKCQICISRDQIRDG